MNLDRRHKIRNAAAGAKMAAQRMALAEGAHPYEQAPAIALAEAVLLLCDELEELESKVQATGARTR